MTARRGGRSPVARVVDIASLVKQLPGFLSRQAWFSARRADDSPAPLPERAEVLEAEVLRDEWPALVWTLVESEGTQYQVPLGVRLEREAIRLLRGREHSVVGAAASPSGSVVAYDALADADLAIALLEQATHGHETAHRARQTGPGISNTTVLCDDRSVLKIYRRVPDGPNPDVEIPEALDAQGFNHLPPPVATWRRGSMDLAVVREFLRGAVEGWALALTSVRDLYASGGAAESAGGDFGDEARRLGSMTGRLHVALASTFPTEEGRPDEWANDVERLVDAVPRGPAGAAAVGPKVSGRGLSQLLDGLRGVANAGRCMRIHGEYHLGRVFRSEVGWYVLDFEGDPRTPLAERRRLRSPLEDIAGILQSLEYATSVAARERGAAERAERADLPGLAAAWERRNRSAFLDGYLSVPGVDELVPGDPGAFELVLSAFETARAAAEVVDEVVHRPWRDPTRRKVLVSISES